MAINRLATPQKQSTRLDPCCTSDKTNHGQNTTCHETTIRRSLTSRATFRLLLLLLIIVKIIIFGSQSNAKALLLRSQILAYYGLYSGSFGLPVRMRSLGTGSVVSCQHQRAGVECNAEQVSVPKRLLSRTRNNFSGAVTILVDSSSSNHGT